MNPIQQGLYVSVVGLVALFVTAAVFYLLLVGMQKLFPAKEETDDVAVETETEQITVLADEKANVAAIAVALHLAQSHAIPGLGDSLQESHSAWWSSRLTSAHKSSRTVNK